ncbi:bifunctional [glutamine synthetase] adenylyltransferase/[glutamine synthetase]-adenylyl-L-tyrosine phosphorylase [Schaalia vaccimaxillae]|uniref:bifunctional [glutamine synthetase] adenylyltransferase/[glutamine synthetase]-adenylyl-L-tyrosine phosphorylase n=1 Tax=Schaalia vaccimaxillae TaxID=183916 RepID=UPI0003B44306|nr:bifunctional [glutamine synthetase] adenylyltransferase/[glutamine synthetase]-adenylyl-L-tyrosine phosphorylase [Schaalia vaccimaxillae]
MGFNPKLARGIGFADPARAGSFLEEMGVELSDWAPALTSCADPDQAVVQLLRLNEADPTILSKVQAQGSDALQRLVAVFGASAALGDYIIAKPERCQGLWDTKRDPRISLLQAVGADPGAPTPIAQPGRSGDDLRRAYRHILLGIAADDLTSVDPIEHMPTVGQRLAALADASLEAALALARRDIDPQGRIPFAIIAMGKTGAQELNYISDVDVVYVVDAGQIDEREAVEIGARLAAMLAQACSGAGEEPPLWTVDANLRPEGRNGVLVRTIDSYCAYWQQWAQTWEFQALLKSRACAGDRELGAKFEEAAAQFIWSAASADNFVNDTRAMRRRVEDNIPSGQADREIKLGPGGLRDVEFTVQLLQLVHGRTDETVRTRSTVDSLAALAAGGYVARTHAAELTNCYCFLRAVEHRAQLSRMRRTHLIPQSPSELRVLGRAIDTTQWVSAEDFHTELERVRLRVRSLHEDVFYRPIIQATADLSADEAALDPHAAQDRLAAIGYLDPKGALHHISALTRGTSRRAMIQRHLLPVFISWLADGADPDLGLLNFRSLSEQIGDSHWYLALLRDSGAAAARLCSMLPNSRWLADALSTRPEAVAWLDSDSELSARPTARLNAEVESLVSRHEEAESAATRVRSVRSREVLRTAMADMRDGISPWRPAISDATDAALAGALVIAQREEVHQSGGAAAEVAFVAMGRYGGRESSYASDADVIAIHRSVNSASEAQAAKSATAIVNRVKSLLGSVTTQMSVAVDLSLRPEGKSGPMSRSVASYRDYYERWAQAWERQALLRARPVCGPADMIDEIMAMIDSIRYAGPLAEQDLRDIRLLKARMEAERLPRGAEPTRHVKLGPGGLTDVEWTVQLLQLRHAHEVVQLRTTSTREALEAARDAGLLDASQAQTLMASWDLASRIRSANVLTSGRTSGMRLDVLAREAQELVPVATMLGYSAGAASDLEEEWLRCARRSRAVMDRKFWE